MLQLYDSNTPFKQQKGRLLLTVPLFLIKLALILTPKPTLKPKIQL